VKCVLRCRPSRSHVRGVININVHSYYSTDFSTYIINIDRFGRLLDFRDSPQLSIIDCHEYTVQLVDMFMFRFRYVMLMLINYIVVAEVRIRLSLGCRDFVWLFARQFKSNITYYPLDKLYSSLRYDIYRVIRLM